MKIKDTISLISKIRALSIVFLKEELKQSGLPDLSPSHGNILYLLIDHEKMSMKDLALAIRRDKSTVTPLVTRLIKYGYIQKYDAPEDSRITYVQLSEKGKRLKDIYQTISDKMLNKALNGLSETDIVQLERMLHLIIKNFEQP